MDDVIGKEFLVHLLKSNYHSTQFNSNHFKSLRNRLCLSRILLEFSEKVGENF